MFLLVVVDITRQMIRGVLEIWDAFCWFAYFRLLIAIDMDNQIQMYHYLYLEG